MPLKMSRGRPPVGRIAYVDGNYRAHTAAGVHIEDRGLQFGDAVYEVCMVLDGRLLDESAHLDRLQRSLSELGIAMPMRRNALRIVLRETMRRNRLHNGFLYLQVTRGAFRRDHAIPALDRPTLIVTARNIDFASVEARRAQGVAVFSTPDIRWGRCDIKSTGLLPNVLAKTKAHEHGAYEAWFVDAAGFITEGASTNAWIVNDKGRAVTRSLSPAILPGVTRAAIIAALGAQGIAIEERSFTLEEAKAAREAFITSATAGAMPVVAIDERPIGNGHPGLVTQQIQAAYRLMAEREAASSR